MAHPISGYRELSEEEIALINELKHAEEDIARVFSFVSNLETVDRRWLSIARTDIETGIMAAVRSIARPETAFDQ